jgi:diaminopimelate decarboxylase
MMVKNINLNVKQLNEFKPFIDYALNSRDDLLLSAKKFGTPQYILDEGLLINNVSRIKNAFLKTIPKSKIFYAFKSNDLPYMIKSLKNQGINADVSCMFEMQLARKLGFKDIIYTAPYMSDEEIQFAIKNDIVINIDNPLVFQRVSDSCSQLNIGAKISFRIQNVAKPWKKFGMDMDTFVSLSHKALNNKNLAWIGIHSHASWNVDAKNYVSNLESISNCLRTQFRKEELSSLKFIDIGGGFTPFESISIEEETIIPVSIESFAKDIGIAVKTHIIDTLGINPEIWLEPGRMISSIPTIILLRVDTIKGDEVITDGGINLVGDALFENECYPVINLSGLSEQNFKLKSGKINGPLCDPSDHWGIKYFGEKLKPGDIIAVMNQGAYTFSTSWRWQRPIAKYIAFNSEKSKNSGGKFLLVKSEETFDQRYAGCKF